MQHWRRGNNGIFFLSLSLFLISWTLSTLVVAWEIQLWMLGCGVGSHKYHFTTTMDCVDSQGISTHSSQVQHGKQKTR